ncbi:MAG: hypothetical protein E6Q50_08355 [Lysobacter sp.]|nr:MAG: hypothetical protein E6Q50_08355 [Lysobacter sp.]
MSAAGLTTASVLPQANVAASDDAVYARMEAMLARELGRQGRIEAMRGLEEVAALLAPRHSEFSDAATRRSPMGREPGAH